ncbi:PAS domain-containing sensor histidine kinase [Pseudomonas knackmussii]|uniref:PAS domain-containing sensor histidine kinase n=1 Tax=Pseudomonas knackmussii TaxID=65741 RepID=UPI00136264F9
MFDFIRSIAGGSASGNDESAQESHSSVPLWRPIDAREELWAPKVAHWDICLEVDGGDRVLRIGGREAHRLQRPAEGGPRPLGDYLERRAGNEQSFGGLRRGERVDLLLRSVGDFPLVCRVQGIAQDNDHYLLVGTDISDLNWQTETQEHKLHCLNLSKLLLSRLRHVTPARLPEAVSEVLESFATSYGMRAMALLLSGETGRARVFACFVRAGADSLLRQGLELPDGELRGLSVSTLLNVADGRSALLDALCSEQVLAVPALTRGGQLACLLGEPLVYEARLSGPSPGDWQHLAEQLANQVLERLNRDLLRDDNRKLSLLQDMVGGGWWRFRPDRAQFELSSAVAGSLGLPAGQTQLALDDLLQRLHPADADELALRLRKLAPGAVLEQVLRLRPESGAGVRRWMRLQGRMQGRDEDAVLNGVLLDISEGKEQEQKAMAAHARLRSLIDSAPVVIYVQRVEEGHLIPEFYSESAGNLLGLDLQAQSWQALAERVHADDLDLFLERGRELLREGRVQAEYRMRDGAGQWHWLYDEAKLLRDAQGMPREAVGLWLDVTERHQAAELIAASEERYRVLVEDSPALICRYSTDLELTFVNRTLADFLGEPVQALLGRRLDHWLAEHDCSALRARLVGASVGSAEASWELRFEMPGQQFRWLVWSDRLLFDDQGRVREVQVVASDNTAVRRAQQQLAQGAKMASLGEMVSGMAHEMKQPLHVMRMALFNARQRPDDAQYLNEKLTRADAQIDRLNRVISHMGVFSRRSELDMAPFDPFHACEEAQQLLGENLAQQGITLELQPPGQRYQVNGFADQLEQVLINLLANARDALLGREEEGARWIGVSQVACAEPGWLELHVRDNAGGIDPALQERIFEAFFTTKPAGKGTGLGLSVSFDLIRNMGGNLSVDNFAGGARFVIRLPLLSSS